MYAIVTDITYLSLHSSPFSFQHIQLRVGGSAQGIVIYLIFSPQNDCNYFKNDFTKFMFLTDGKAKTHIDTSETNLGIISIRTTIGKKDLSHHSCSEHAKNFLRKVLCVQQSFSLNVLRASHLDNMMSLHQQDQQIKEHWRKKINS